jgi:hypothetical protein
MTWAAYADVPERPGRQPSDLLPASFSWFSPLWAVSGTCHAAAARSRGRETDRRPGTAAFPRRIATNTHGSRRPLARPPDPLRDGLTRLDRRGPEPAQRGCAYANRVRGAAVPHRAGGVGAAAGTPVAIIARV